MTPAACRLVWLHFSGILVPLRQRQIATMDELPDLAQCKLPEKEFFADCFTSEADLTKTKEKI